MRTNAPPLKTSAHQQQPSTETVHARCPACASRLTHKPARRVITCPTCAESLGTSDIRIEGTLQTASIRTTGAVTIATGADASVAEIHAAGAVTIHGTLEANIHTLSTIRLTNDALWRGNAAAAAADIAPGATAEGPITIHPPATPASPTARTPKPIHHTNTPTA